MLHYASNLSITQWVPFKSIILDICHRSTLKGDHTGLSLDTLAQQGNQPSEIPTNLPKSQEDMTPWEMEPFTGRAEVSAGHSHLTADTPGPKGIGFLGTAKGWAPPSPASTVGHYPEDLRVVCQGQEGLWQGHKACHAPTGYWGWVMNRTEK